MTLLGFVELSHTPKRRLAWAWLGAADASTATTAAAQMETIRSRIDWYLMCRIGAAQSIEGRAPPATRRRPSRRRPGRADGGTRRPGRDQCATSNRSRFITFVHAF